jgi:hypothetical protein
MQMHAIVSHSITPREFRGELEELFKQRFYYFDSRSMSAKTKREAAMAGARASEVLAIINILNSIKFDAGE